MQRVVLPRILFPRIWERSPRRPAIGGLGQSLFLLRVQPYPKFGASRFSTAGMASLRRVA